jgi:myo-inositol-1(or 4)-monophosphatase
MRDFLDVAIEAARAGGDILLEEYARPAQISYKGEVDLVTQADRRSEVEILGILRHQFPEHAIVAEESGASGGALVGGAAPRWVWYVDPLDGTTNFAHGYPSFCVSICLTENGTPVIAVVFDPTRGELFSARRGAGAQLNGRSIRVSPINSLAKALLSTGFPAHKRTQRPNIHYYWDFTLRSHGVRRDGSAAIDLSYVACGRFEGFWEFGLKPWDTAAGILLVEEAGGRVTEMDGAPYLLDGKSTLASNGVIHGEMVEVARSITERSDKLPG